MVANIKTLRERGELPDDVTIDYIDGDGDVSDVVNPMKANDVVWHNCCRNKVDKQQVERAQLKRMNTLVNANPVETRRLINDDANCQTNEEHRRRTCVPAM